MVWSTPLTDHISPVGAKILQKFIQQKRAKKNPFPDPWNIPQASPKLEIWKDFLKSTGGWESGVCLSLREYVKVFIENHTWYGAEYPVGTHSRELTDPLDLAPLLFLLSMKYAPKWESHHKHQRETLVQIGSVVLSSSFRGANEFCSMQRPTTRDIWLVNLHPT